MWKPVQDVKGGVGPEDSKLDERPSQRRRWDAICESKLLPAHLEYSPPRPSRWDASTQVPTDRKVYRPCVEYNNSSSSSLLRPSRCWDARTQVPSELKLRSSRVEYVPLRPARIAGGSGCNCSCPCPPIERPVESCLPGLHQKYVDVYEQKSCKEGHLPAGYRSFVEHDDLHLPPSRPLSPASTDHDDLYLPLKMCDDYSPRDACPCIDMCASDPTYGDIYLPPSRPCTPVFPKETCGYQAPPTPRECFSLGGLQSAYEKKTPKIQCSCPPYIKILPSCPAPPSNDCSCPPYIKKLPGYSPTPSCFPSPPSSPSPPPCHQAAPNPCSRPALPCSTVYIDEVPSPPAGNRYIPCQECLCHKDLSTRSLCPSPNKISPCRDCVCHLGSRSPSQGGGKPGPTRCQAGFQTPVKPRLKLHLNQSQCLECKSPYSCKGPPNCNPQYIVETPLSPNSARSRSRSPSPGGGGGKCSSAGPALMSSRCQSCDCHKDGGTNSFKCTGPPKVSPKLFEDPCCSPCRPVTPCRPLLAAEMLSGMEACASKAKACGKSAASCVDPRCASCDCHKCPPSPPRSPCRPAPPSPWSPCRPLPPPSSCRPAGPSCSSFDSDIHNPSFKSPSPRCKDCDCHKPKNCKLSTQICKFCRGAGWCYCEYHTTQQQLLLAESSELEPSSQMEVVTQVTGLSPEDSYRSGIELPSKAAKVEFESPCAEETESIPRAPAKDQQPEVTQLCCCGKCEYTQPRFPIKTECPFCKHVHPCCCGMCSCPIPTCSSKTPLSLDGPTPRLLVNSSGASTGRGINPGLYSHRPKSAPQVPRKKGFASPEKSASKSPFSSSNPQLSSARVCYPSPRTRMKLNLQQSPTRR